MTYRHVKLVLVRLQICDLATNQLSRHKLEASIAELPSWYDIGQFQDFLVQTISVRTVQTLLA
jgi:hypothetical protein